MAEAIYSTGTLHAPRSCFLHVEPPFGAVVVSLGVAAGLAMMGSARIRRVARRQAMGVRPQSRSWA